MSEILKIGAEFDVSQIVAGSAQAGAAFDHLSASAKQMATELQAAGNSTEEIYSQMTAAGISAATAATAVQSLGVVTQKTAAATEAAVVATRSYSEEAIRARVTTDVLTGNISRAENALIRFASHGSIIGPIMQAAFLPFAAIAFTEILSHMYESFQKLSDGVMGYTEEVKKAYAEDVKFSNEALSQAGSLEEAQMKLTETLREEGAAAQTFGAKFGEANRQQEESSSILLRTIPILGEAIVLYESLATAQSAAANASILQSQTQRALIVEEMKLNEDRSREAVKLIDLDVQAKNAQLSGDSARVDSIRNEIAALNSKTEAEKESAKYAAGLKFPNNPEAATAAAHESGTRIEEESYLKRIELTGQLSTAENALAFKRIEERNSEIEGAAKAAGEELKQIEEVQRKKDEAAKKSFDDAWKEFDVNQQVQEDITKEVEAEVKAREKFMEDSRKIAEQASVQKINTQEAGATANAELQKQKVSGSGIGGFGELRELEAIDAAKLAEIHKFEDEKLAIEIASAQQAKAAVLGNQTEGEFKTANSGNFPQLQQLADANAKIDELENQRLAKDAAYNAQIVLNAQKTADAQTAAYMKAFQPINRAMDGMVNGILQGTLTIQQAFVRMGANIALTTIDALAQMALKWAEHEAVTTLVHAVGVQQKVAITATGEAETKAITASSTMSQVLMNAVKAGTAAAGAVAGIPVIGPVLAIIAGDATFAAVLAMGALASAAVGAEIPSDMPLFVHAGETVAPKPLSAAMHSLAPNIQKFNMAMNAPSAAAPAAAGPSSSSVSNISVQAFDASSFRDFAHRNQKQFVQAARGMIRNGAR